MFAVTALLAAGCERQSHGRETKPVSELTPKPPVAESDPKHAVAEQLIDKLAAGAEARIPDLGSFEVREYKAYNGRNPRTGETVYVPSKRLPFFKVDSATRDYLNGRGKAPSTAWVARLLDELRASKSVVFGRMGGFLLRTKPSALGRDPQTGGTVEIPARSVLTFSPSRQLKRKLSGSPAVKLVESAMIDAMLAKLAGESPRTLAEFDAAFAKLGLDYKASGVVEASSRESDDSGVIVVGTNEDGDPSWYFDGSSVFEPEDDEGEQKFAVDRWAADMLVVAAVRTVAHDEVLQVRDAQRVLARLGSDTPFTLSDLPY